MPIRARVSFSIRGEDWVLMPSKYIVLLLTLTNAYTKKIQETIQKSFQGLEVVSIEIDEVAECLNHSRRQPDAHIFLRAEARDILT